MTLRLRQYWPALIVIAVLLLDTGQAILRSLDFNDGHWVYALDDAYIHAAIAKNFAAHGVWGVSQYGFTSASSSPLWTGLLALFYVFIGPWELLPLVLNLIFAVLLILAIDFVLTQSNVPPLYRLFIGLAVVILLPLNTLILIGMEHVLQILLVVLFSFYTARMITTETLPPLRSWQFGRVLLLGILLGSVRYEGLFLVAIFCALMLLRLSWQHVTYAVILGAVSAVPIGLYGLIAISNGWQFLPTSLIIKSDANYLSSVGLGGWFQYFIEDTYNIMANQHVMSLLVLAALALFILRYARVQSLWDVPQLMLIAFVGITLINVRLVSWPEPGTFSRYEAYLVALAFVVLAAALGPYLPRRFEPRHWPVLLVSLLLVAFLGNDVYHRYEKIAYEEPVVTATRDIYSQQYQMARFLDRYYSGAVVGANDIGAINFFADINNVDFWGLGTIEIARAVEDNRYNTEFIRQYMADRGGQIAVFYEPWLDLYGGTPAEWVKVADWELQRDPAILGYHIVSFYAVDPAEAPTLMENLRAFTPELPEGILVAIVNQSTETP